MNKNKLLALVLAAVMSVSTVSVAFAAGNDDEAGAVSVTANAASGISTWEELKAAVENATAEDPVEVKLTGQVTISEEGELKNCIIDATDVSDAGKSGGAIVVTGNFTFENVKLTVDDDCRYGIHFYGSESTLTNVEVAGGKYAAVLANNGSKLTVTGGSYAGSSWADIELNVKEKENPGKVTVTGAELASEAVFIDAASTENLVGTVEGKTPEEIAQAVKDVIGGDVPLTVEVTKGESPIQVDENGAIVMPDTPDTPDDDDNKPARDDDDGDYYGTEKWDEVKAQIADAEDGDTIKVSATGLPYFPSSVARALKGKDITLEIRKNGVTYTVNGLEIGAVEKIWYEFENIETQLLTAEAPDAETGDQGGKANPDTGR